jgi:hypothetical protein
MFSASCSCFDLNNKDNKNKDKVELTRQVKGGGGRGGDRHLQIDSCTSNSKSNEQGVAMVIVVGM